jgi:hypothetical protein
VAQLQNKVAKFALARDGGVVEPVTTPSKPPAPSEDALRELVWEVLTKQLGHRPSEASELITAAFKRRSGIETVEDLFDEIYRGRKP